MTCFQTSEAALHFTWANFQLIGVSLRILATSPAHSSLIFCRFAMAKRKLWSDESMQVVVESVYTSREERFEGSSQAL